MGNVLNEIRNVMVAALRPGAAPTPVRVAESGGGAKFTPHPELATPVAPAAQRSTTPQPAGQILDRGKFVRSVMNGPLATSGERKLFAEAKTAHKKGEALRDANNIPTALKNAKTSQLNPSGRIVTRDVALMESQCIRRAARAEMQAAAATLAPVIRAMQSRLAGGCAARAVETERAERSAAENAGVAFVPSEVLRCLWLVSRNPSIVIPDPGISMPAESLFAL